MIGVCSTYTYVIILFAFRAAPVGYVASLRESAIVFGAIAGMVFLKEKPVWYKFVAIALIVAGAVCIKLA